MGKSKYYVVWHGVSPGIYSSWTDCKLQINGFEGAIYKSFDSKEEAEKAYSSSPYLYIQRKPKDGTDRTSCDNLTDVPTDRTDTILPLPSDVPAEALAVDAACSGNPGPMEYRGVYLRTGETVFHVGPIFGTNNIGEFLAIVHALALMTQKGICLPIFSDSRNAIGWINQKKCKTKLKRTPQTEEIHKLIERAETWLRTHTCTIPIRKWETARWGEIPADFGRK